MLYLSPGEMYEFRSLVKHEQDPTCAPGLMVKVDGELRGSIVIFAVEVMAIVNN